MEIFHVVLEGNTKQSYIHQFSATDLSGLSSPYVKNPGSATDNIKTKWRIDSASLHGTVDWIVQEICGWRVLSAPLLC